MKYDWKDIVQGISNGFEKRVKWIMGFNVPQEAYVAVEEAKKEPELVVGEPVKSFVALVKSNPKRFKMRLRYSSELVSHYYITDLVTKEVFWYSEEIDRTWQVGDYRVFEYKYSGNPDFLTQDEWKYVVREIGEDSNKKVVERYTDIKYARSNRLQREARQRLVDMYCTK